MAAPDDQAVNDMVSEIESMAVDEHKSDGKEPMADEDELSPNETPSEKEVSNTSGVKLEDLSVANEVATSTANSISASHRPKALSLPAELRIHILRYLLLERRPLSTYWKGSGYLRYPAILKYCTVIRREAFQILYGENVFYLGFMHRTVSILRNPRIGDMIQNIHFDVRLNEESPARRRSIFISLLREFGTSAILRGTLNIIFRVDPHNNDLLSWFARGLPRFTNFRTIQMEFLPGSSAQSIAASHYLMLCRTYEADLAPVFGPALSFADGRGLKFHPQGYLDSLPPQVDIDWMDNVDGMRLDWNHDPPTNADLTEA